MRTFLSTCVALFIAGCGGGVTPTALDDAGLDAGPLGTDAGQPDAGFTCGAGVSPSPGVVLTSTGAISGRLDGDVYAFLGIPYVAPPLGALRWRPPEPDTCWPGVRPATSYGPMCPQQGTDGGLKGEEDCLTLNIFAKQGAQSRPVMVWIHGGGNTEGSGSDALFDGHQLASTQNVVVVTFNYRLGALGFFTHPQLDAESDAGVSGNYGLLDQQAALRWVKANVAAFGGDPTRVLVFGESAGGQDTLLHLVAPGSKGLFSAAISESGGTYRTTLAQAESALLPVVTSAGCDTAADALACLRAANASTFAALGAALNPLAKTGLKFSPVVDGVVLPDQPLTLIAQGKQAGVPVILGTNADETSRMVANVTTDAQYQAAVQAQYGAMLGNQVLTQYPSSRFASPRAALIAVTTDATWTCPIRRLARSLTATQQAPVYRYFFTWRAPGAAGGIVGSTHGLEVPFVFDSFSAVSAGFMPDAAAQSLSATMQGAWANFAATGAPPASLAWPVFPMGGDGALELGTPLAVLPGVRTGDCDFIDSLTP
jgi:para-nitrobenzyl esterase